MVTYGNISLNIGFQSCNALLETRYTMDDIINLEMSGPLAGVLHQQVEQGKLTQV